MEFNRLVNNPSLIKTQDSDFINCRTASNVFKSLIQYKLDTCAKCYDYIPDWAFKNKFLYYQNGYLYDTSQQKFVRSNSTAEISSTFLHLTMASKWLQCCKEAELCCVNQLNRTALLYQSKNRCPKTWDGWQCWGNGADPDELATMSCPSHIYWLSFNPPPCLGYVTKKCLTNGTWYEQNGREWSNFGSCARDDIYIKRSWYKITTHVISVAFIIPALFIFNYYRQLSRVSRIRVHKHLLSSILIYSILMALLTFQMLLNNSVTSSSVASVSVDNLSSSVSSDSSKGPSIKASAENAGAQQSKIATINFTTIFCISISLTVKYFRSTSYLWMFNEAFYLHRLIKQAFAAPSLTPLLIIAYGIPTVTTTLYICFRLIQLDLDFASTAASLVTNHSYESSNASTHPSPSASKLVSKYIDQINVDDDSDLLSLNSTSSYITQMTIDKKISEKFGFLNLSTNLKSITLGPIEMRSSNLESINVHHPPNDTQHSNSSDLDEVVTDQLNDLIGTSYEDQCWSLPSPIAWHEWIINLPNLCILVVNCIFLFKMLREIYLKAQSGQKRMHLQQRSNQTTVHNSSSSYSRPMRACFLFAVWSNKSKKSLPVSASPSVSPNAAKYLNPAFGTADDRSNPSLNSSIENSDQILKDRTVQSNQFKASNSQREVIEDENRSVLIGHVIDDNNNQSDIDLGDFAVLKDTVKCKRSSLKTGFSKSRSALKRQLSRLTGEKELEASIRPSNPEQHTGGHRTSILVSLRAASILLPLYGLHYLVFVYRLDTTVCWLSELYHYCSITLDGLQGMLVSILFCFATNEVQQVLKRSLWERS